MSVMQSTLTKCCEHKEEPSDESKNTCWCLCRSIMSMITFDSLVDCFWQRRGKNCKRKLKRTHEKNNKRRKSFIKFETKSQLLWKQHAGLSQIAFHYDLKNFGTSKSFSITSEIFMTSQCFDWAWGRKLCFVKTFININCKWDEGEGGGEVLKDSE